MNFPIAALIGFFLGFAFGVGCALAVKYSIYMGGYRAAVQDGRMATKPDRLVREEARQAQESREKSVQTTARTTADSLRE